MASYKEWIDSRIGIWTSSTRATIVYQSVPGDAARVRAIIPRRTFSVSEPGSLSQGFPVPGKPWRFNGLDGLDGFCRSITASLAGMLPVEKDVGKWLTHLTVLTVAHRPNRLARRQALKPA
jgi:hypothetical protein